MDLQRLRRHRRRQHVADLQLPGRHAPFTATPCIAFNPDPLNQPHTGGAGSTIAVDLIDPDFDFPRVLRATLGYDRVLPWNIRATVEGVWSQTQKDVFYKNVAKVRSGISPLDGRPRFTSDQLHGHQRLPADQHQQG